MSDRHERNQLGFSLIEALLALAITSSAILVVALGIQVAVETDGQTSQIQRGGVALTTVTEAVRSNDVAFEVCPATSPTIEQRYKASVTSRLRDVDRVAIPDFEILQIDFWEPPVITATSTTGGVFRATSTTTTSTLGPNDPGVAGQCVPLDATMLRMKVAVKIGSRTITGEVVKRKPLEGEGF